MAFPTKSAKFIRASSQYAQAADSTSLSITGNITLETHVKCNTAPGNGIGCPIIFKGDYNLHNSYQLLYLNDGGTMKLMSTIFSGDGNANYCFSKATQTLTIGEWFHVAVVITVANSLSTKFEFFVNGTSIGNGTTGSVGTVPTSIWDGNTELGIALNGDPTFLTTTYVFDGQFCLARVWSVARTASEISNNRYSILGSTTNLKAEWTFDDTWNDNSGNSNTLSPTNTPTFVSDVPSQLSYPTSPEFMLNFY